MYALILMIVHSICRSGLEDRVSKAESLSGKVNASQVSTATPNRLGGRPRWNSEDLGWDMGSSNTMGVRTERLEVGISVSPSLDRRVVSASCLVQAQTPVTPPHVFLFLGFNPYPSPTGGMLPSPQNHSCWRPSAASSKRSRFPS